MGLFTKVLVTIIIRSTLAVANGRWNSSVSSEDKNHRPNSTRIAFWADTREEVDQISKLVRDAGGKNLEGPEVCEDYSPGYYAFFCEDPDGNKLEICCREKPVFAD